MQAITVQPVGVIHNEIQQAMEADWGKVVSTIHFDAALVPGLTGLADWSHVLVVFSMHQTQFEMAQDLLRRPQARADMPQVGIFAQRGSRRPNTIGVTAVRLLGVEGPVVTVRGLDAIDGTPVLDIKPYAPIYDGVSDPLVPAWFIQLMQGYF